MREFRADSDGFERRGNQLSELEQGDVAIRVAVQQRERYHYLVLQMEIGHFVRVV